MDDPPMPPKVTVLMPVYNGERFTRRDREHACVKHAAIFELLIVNDGSTDESRSDPFPMLIREFAWWNMKKIEESWRR